MSMDSVSPSLDGAFPADRERTSEPSKPSRPEPSADFEHIPFAAYRPGPHAAVEPRPAETAPRSWDPPAPAADLPVPPWESTRAEGQSLAEGHGSAASHGPTATHGIADDVDHSLDPRSITLGRIGGLIGTLILSGVLGIAAVIVSFSVVGSWPLAVGAWALLSLLLTVRAWVWPGLAYRHTSYRLNDRGLVIRRGVLWRSVAHVPRSRVQHTDVSQGPLERYFELGTLTVHTAGTQFASVSLDGLTHETACGIRDVLIEAGEGDGV